MNRPRHHHYAPTAAKLFRRTDRFSDILPTRATHIQYESYHLRPGGTTPGLWFRYGSRVRATDPRGRLPP